jgi:signal transduction histidine kinase
MALYLLRHEQDRIAAARRAAAADRALAIAETLALAVREVEEELGQRLAALPESDLTPALTAMAETSPLIRNVFALRPDGTVALPDTTRPLTTEERGFLQRYDALFAGRVSWAFPEPEAVPAASADRTAQQAMSLRRELAALAREAATAPAAPAAGRAAGSGAASGAPLPRRRGWIPWFAENQLHLLGWVATSSGLRYGVELEMMALLGRVAAALPAAPAGGEAFAVVDGGGRVVHQAGAPDPARRPPSIAEASVGAALPHWRIAVFALDGTAGGLAGRAFVPFAALLVSILAVATLSGGSLLLWQAQQNLRDAAQKTTFVANVSHELKTPLTTIRLYAELLAAGRIRDEARQRQYLDVMVAESQRLTRIVNNVLDFGRLEQRRKQYHPEAIEVGALLGSLLASHRLSLEQAGLAPVLDLPPHPLRAFADRDAVEQAVLNLLDNAAKYAAEGREVRVEAAEEGGCAVIRVLDRGPGVPEAHRERIFEKFHRVDDSLTARQPGSGLGLTIARRMLRDLGGDVVYEPRAGGGAAFRVTLPLAPAAQEGQA